MVNFGFDFSGDDQFVKVKEEAPFNTNSRAHFEKRLFNEKTDLYVEDSDDIDKILEATREMYEEDVFYDAIDRFVRPRVPDSGYGSVDLTSIPDVTLKGEFERRFGPHIPKSTDQVVGLLSHCKSMGRNGVVNIQGKYYFFQYSGTHAHASRYLYEITDWD